MQGFIIGFAPDADQPMNFYWSGTAPVAIDSTKSPDDAMFFDLKSEARQTAGKLQIDYPNQEVAVIPVTKAIQMSVAATPEILPPAAPAAAPTTTTPTPASNTSPTVPSPIGPSTPGLVTP